MIKLVTNVHLIEATCRTHVPNTLIRSHLEIKWLYFMFGPYLFNCLKNLQMYNMVNICDTICRANVSAMSFSFSYNYHQLFTSSRRHQHMSFLCIIYIYSYQSSSLSDTFPVSKHVFCIWRRVHHIQ